MFPIPHLTPNQWSVVAGITGCFVLLSWWSIRDAMGREFGSSNEKLFWLQLAVLVPFLGGLAYVLFGRNRGKKLV